MDKYLVALDQGTTTSRAVVFSKKGELVASHSVAFTQIFPKPGWVEHNPLEILKSQITALREAVSKAGINPDSIAAIGITNQRETTLIWDADGNPVHPAIVWQCRRTAPLVEKLIEAGHTQLIRSKTGLLPDAYFSGTKMEWFLDEIEGARTLAEKGKLHMGTVDSFLAYHLTSERAFVTDATNASRTMLFNIHTQEWDDELLAIMHLPREALPDVVDTSQVIGTLKPDILSNTKPIPIAALAGDQQAALFGQACFEPGMAKNTYGTGNFLLMQTGERPFESANNLLTTIAWRIGGKVNYALEGSVFVGGAAIQWLRDELKLIDTAAESEAVAISIADNGGVYCVPAFTGLGAPYWDMYARGTLVGMTRGTGRAHIVRAVLESIAFQSMDVLEAMVADSGVEMKQLRVDGGASTNNFLMQFQADLLDMPVTRPRVFETTALGAAFLAGLGAGMYSGLSEIAESWNEQQVFVPRMAVDDRERYKEQWRKAVECSRGFAGKA